MVDHPKYQIIAVVSGILTILGFSHLVFRVHTTKETEHLTFTWIFLVLSAQILLMIYGILINSYGIYLPPIILISGLLDLGESFHGLQGVVQTARDPRCLLFRRPGAAVDRRVPRRAWDMTLLSIRSPSRQEPERS